jgi:hypothetical protein
MEWDPALVINMVTIVSDYMEWDPDLGIWIVTIVSKDGVL